MFTASMTKLRNAFLAEGSDIRIVGGAVRDFLLGKEPKDIDFATPSTPVKMQHIAHWYGFGLIPTGIEHGTVTFIVDDEQFEVTTLRKDVSTDGRNATVEYTESWREDALRRDFTINAMSMDFDGNIHDYYDGMLDLGERRLRFVGNARDRIREDYLRIMRYFRFIAQLGWMYDDETPSAIHLEKHGLIEHVSVERIWAEMKKLLNAPGAQKAMAGLMLTGVARDLGLERSENIYLLPQADDAIAKLSLFVPLKDRDFGKKWKMSHEEFSKLSFMVKEANSPPPNMVISFYQNMLVDGFPRDWVLSSLRLFNPEFVSDFETWEIPVFPVKGQDLLDEGYKPGKKIGFMLEYMKARWKDSRFIKTKEELLYENYRVNGEG